MLKILQMRIFLVLLTLLHFSSFVESYEKGEYEKGLYLRSNEVEKNSRTSLNLTPDKSIVLHNGLSMSFDVKLRPAQHNYGYIFRIIANDSLNIDLLSMDVEPEKDLFSLVVKNKSVIRFNEREFKQVDIYDWMTVKLVIDPQTSQLKVTINGIERQYAFNSITLKDFRISFGANYHSIFMTTDVSTITIRNINLYDEDRLIRSWELGKHGVNVVYDSCIQAKALVKNPVWEIDDHVRWKKEATLLFPFIDPQIAFDEESGNLFVAKDQSVFIYNVITKVSDTILVKRGMPYDTRANQMIYDKNKGELVSYNFDSNDLNRFNFDKKEWEQHYTDYIPPNRWHHSKIFIPEENILLAVGGYGFYQYKRDITIYSMQKREWLKFQGDSALITPRYLGSLGYLGDSIFLYFGGLGNASGNQDELPRNYYDLFKIDIKANTVEKLWSLEGITQHFVNGNSLIIDKTQQAFFTLTHPDKLFFTTIQLRKFDIATGASQLVGDSIAFRFNDNESYCDLFYCKPKKKLIAVAAHSEKSGTCDVEIFSISFPPLNVDDVLQKETAYCSSAGWPFILIVSILVLFVCCWLILVIKRKKLLLSLKKRSVSRELRNQGQVVNKKTINPPLKQKNIQKSSIILLGEFQIIDNEGTNITNRFSTIIRQIFLLTLLHTIINRTGITTSKLIELIWGQDEDKRMRNNLYVNINKLRSLIKTIDQVEVISHDGSWSITLGDKVYCDYKNLMALINIIDEEEDISKDLLHEIINLSLTGSLLPDLSWACLDSLKSEYADLLIDKLSSFMELEEVRKDMPLLLKIANAILVCDSIDENAMIKKCYALYHLGKKRQTIECFEMFRKDYLNLLGTEYKSTFNEFMEEHILNRK